MIRFLLTAGAALLLLGAAKSPRVDYRLAVETAAGGGARLEVELRFRGDADGETRLLPPARAVQGLTVSGGESDGGVVRHRPGARLAVRYRIALPPAAGGLALLGEEVFAAPGGRAAEAATFRWGRTPKGWATASDLDPGAAERAISVSDIRRSVILAGPDLRVAEIAVAGGAVRAAAPGPADAARIAAAAAPVVVAQRAFWGDDGGRFLVAVGPFGRADAIDRDDAIALPAGAASDAAVREAVARAGMRAQLPARTAGGDATPPWFANGLADLLADRVLLRAGLITPDAVVGRLAAADRASDPDARGAILALKWDEDIRRRTQGRADLDDVVLRMRDHRRRFAAGQGPDFVTGLVSATWVTAGLDLRGDIARYATGGGVPLPETLLDGCLDARVVVSPGFDTGFDPEASRAAGAVKGVRRRGPAWNSGVRDGMRLDTLEFGAGDTSREVTLRVRPARGGKARTIRYWPYGDADVETRRIRFAGELAGDAMAACTRRLGGL